MRNSSGFLPIALAAIVSLSPVQGIGESRAAEPMAERKVLPPPAPEFKGKIGSTYKDSIPDFSPALPPKSA
jgi:hypothetical protein